MKRKYLVVSGVFVLAVAVGAFTALRCRDSKPEFVRYPFPLQAIQRSDLAQANFYEKKLKQNPDSFLDTAELASVYLRLGKSAGDFAKVDEAEKLALQSLKLLKNGNKKAKMILADIAEIRHEFKEAIRISKEIFQEDSRAIGALSTVITSNVALGELDEAIQFADQLIDITPDSGSYALRSLVWQGRGRLEEAELDLVKAINQEDIGGQTVSAWVRGLLGRLYLLQGKYDLASRYITEALRLDPEQALSLGLKADLAYERGELNEAASSYTQAFKISGAPLFLIKQGKVLKEMGQTAQAESLWTQAEKIVRKDMTGRYGHPADLVILQIERGKQSDMAEAVRLAAKEASLRRDAPTLYHFAWALSWAGKNEDAWKIARELIWRGVDNPRYLTLASQIREKLGDKRTAEFLSRRAFRINPRLRKA